MKSVGTRMAKAYESAWETAGCSNACFHGAWTVGSSWNGLNRSDVVRLKELGCREKPCRRQTCQKGLGRDRRPVAGNKGAARRWTWLIRWHAGQIDEARHAFA